MNRSVADLASPSKPNGCVQFEGPERAHLYMRPTAENGCGQPDSGFPNRVSEVRVLPGAPYLVTLR